MSELFPSQILAGSFALRTYKENDIHQYPQAIPALVTIEILTLAAATDYIIDLTALNQSLQPLSLMAYFFGGTPNGELNIEVLDPTGTQTIYGLTISLTANTLGAIATANLPLVIFPPSCQLKLTPTVLITKLNLYAKKVVIEKTINST